jgi:hypothetical protein
MCAYIIMCVCSVVRNYVRVGVRACVLVCTCSCVRKYVRLSA